MPVAKNTSSHYYPLTKMNFLVTVAGISAVAAFSEVTGIESTVEVIEFRQGNAGSMAPVKIPGLVKHGNITLRMGYTREQPFKTWIASCTNERRKVLERHEVTIEMIDVVSGPTPDKLVESGSGATGICWVLKDAWVAKYTGPDLNASTSEVAIEAVEIAYEELVIPN